MFPFSQPSGLAMALFPKENEAESSQASCLLGGAEGGGISKSFPGQALWMIVLCCPGWRRLSDGCVV